jgi:WD40 repeat protein/tRNA A-37 threonylcarbamoyl transferase component Bud32
MLDRQDLPPAIAVRQLIDALCDEFEQLWQSGDRPALPSFIARVSAADQPLLLRELVALDCDYRRERGETPAAADYFADSAEQAAVISAALQDRQSLRKRTGETTAARPADTQALAAPPPMQRSEQLPNIPGYEVLEFVAQGGMGVVYRGRDRQLAREVALKLPRSGYLGNAQEKERFVREAIAAARVRHPNICPVYEVREAHGQPYIAMAFIHGVTLKAWRKQVDAKPRQIAELMATIARAVQAAHDQGLIHRDLKPSNVMVEQGSGQPMLMDFGLAKDLTSTDGLTMTGDVLGTPAYMAPEQAAGTSSDVGKHSDVYALGAILYELLTGKPPFEGTLAEILQQVQHAEPSPVRKGQPLVHRDLETICGKAMAKRPAERYASAGALATDLDRFSLGEPILARRQSPLTAAQRFVQKYPVAFGLAAIIVLLLAVGAIGYPAVQRNLTASQLTGRLQANLHNNRWTPAQLSVADAIVDKLAAINPEAASRQRRQIADRLEEFIEFKLSLPRVRDDADQPEIEGAVTALAPRDPDAAARLRLDVAKRFGSWVKMSELKGPFFKPVALIPALVPADDAQSLAPPIAADFTDYNPNWFPTSQPGEINHRIDATFLLPGKAECGLAFNAIENLRGGIQSLAISPDSRWIAVGSSKGGPIRVWNENADPQFNLPGHEAPVINLVFAAEGKYLVSAGLDRQVKVWDTSTRKLVKGVQVDKPGSTEEGHDYFLPLAVPKSGDRVFVGGHAAIICYSLPDLKEISSLPAELTNALAINEDGSRLVSASWSGAVKMWDTTTGIGLWTMPVETGRNLVLALSPDGKTLATTTARLVRLHDASTSRVINSLPGMEGAVHSLAFDPAGKRIAASHQHGALKVWDIASGEVLATRFLQRLGTHALAYDPTGSWLVHGSESVLQKLDGGTLHELWSLRDQSYLFQLVRSEDGGSVKITMSRNGSVLRDVDQPLGAGPVRLTARRQQDSLHLQVNQNPAIEFVDYFAPRAVEGGQLCVVLSPGASLTEFGVQRAQPRIETSPLDAGNREFRAARFTAAFDHFQQQVTSPSSRLTTEVQHEARLKSALCLLRMNRAPEAKAVFQELAATPGKPTPFITFARFHLWLLLTEQKEWEAVDALAETMEVAHPFQEMVEVIPREFHLQIFELYSENISRRSASALAGTAHRLQAIERLINYFRIEEGRSAAITGALFEGLVLTQQNAAANRAGRLYLSQRMPHLQNLGLFVNNYWHAADWRRCGLIARWLEEPHLAEQPLDKLLFAADGSLKTEIQGHGWWLVQERARLFAHRGKWERALELLDACWEHRHDRHLTLESQIDFALLRGIALQKLDRQREAKATWSEMARDERVIARAADIDNGNSEEVMQLIVLRGLAGDFDEAFVSGVGKFALVRLRGSDSTQLLSQLPLTPELLSGMWQSERGQKYAAEIAKGNLIITLQIRALMLLYVHQMVRQGAIKDATVGEDNMIWQLAETGFQRYTENQLSMPAFLQLVLGWKGIPAPLGWKFAFAGVPENMRAPCAYILARRFLLREQPKIAKELFTLTLEYGKDDELLRSRATEYLQE